MITIYLVLTKKKYKAKNIVKNYSPAPTNRAKKASDLWITNRNFKINMTLYSIKNRC
jgi:hypothetical protein